MHAYSPVNPLGHFKQTLSNQSICLVCTSDFFSLSKKAATLGCYCRKNYRNKWICCNRMETTKPSAKTIKHSFISYRILGEKQAMAEFF